MQCPECGSPLVYDEHVNGMYSCPVKNGIIEWEDREFSGECYGHAVRCVDCGYELPGDALNEMLSKSLEK